MPLTDFYSYTITDPSANNLLVAITIDPTHDVYKGHFPQQPVTPGVVLVEIARKILSDHLGKNLFFSSAKELKFMSPILPEQNTQIDLSITYDEIEDGYKAACIFKSDETVFTKLKGTFRAS